MSVGFDLPKNKPEPGDLIFWSLRLVPMSVSMKAFAKSARHGAARHRAYILKQQADVVARL